MVYPNKLLWHSKNSYLLVKRTTIKPTMHIMYSFIIFRNVGLIEATNTILYILKNLHKGNLSFFYLMKIHILIGEFKNI